ncbi:MAG TPA: hypothetical protein VK982_06230 [Bacteroidales bacterium]|nr:hypothetical protein [Bacteroidales bacterium]
MKTYNEIIENLEELKKVPENIVCNEEVIFSLTIPFENHKARNNAKYYGFKFNWDRKTWEKKSNTCVWQMTDYISNIFKY